MKEVPPIDNNFVLSICRRVCHVLVFLPGIVSACLRLCVASNLCLCGRVFVCLCVLRCVCACSVLNLRVYVCVCVCVCVC